MVAVPEPAPAADLPQGRASPLPGSGLDPHRDAGGLHQEQLLLRQTALQFCKEQVLPRATEIEAKKEGCSGAWSARPASWGY